MSRLTRFLCQQVWICCLAAALGVSTAAYGQPAQTPPSRQLDAVFLFHFNQHHVPAAKVASLAGYIGLLETLRAHPDLPFQIQISGTLLNGLTWFDDRAIQLIKEGVDAGQFEIVGSTYSQNVMFASNDEWTNARQIETHRKLLLETFGIEPVGFWNPERVWTQSFVPLLAGHGYRYTMIERHIVEDSDPDATFHQVRSTRLDGSELLIVPDDTDFLDVFAVALRSGSADTLYDYLRPLYEADTNDRLLIGYFQDAEAHGLWQFEAREDPQAVWQRLDSVLTVIEGWDWLNVTTGARFIEEHGDFRDVSPIADGQADWMIDFARNTGQGYEDWYDYWRRDPIQEGFRTARQPVEDSLHAIRTLLEDQTDVPSGATKLFKRAVRTFLSHEYEFGASWMWSPTTADFFLVRESLVSLLAARLAVQPAQRTWQEDVNQDGVDEFMTSDSDNLFVFTAEGGRLLYWFDLERGESLVGNENFTHYAEQYVDGGRYIPVLRGARNVYPWHANNAILPEIFDWTFQIRRRALNDWIYNGGILVDSLVYRTYQSKVGDQQVMFRHTSGDITLEKTIVVADDGLSIQYELSNESDRRQALTLVIESGFSPSYVDVMDDGPASLTYWNEGPQTSLDPLSTRGVQNVNTGSTVYYTFTDPPFYVEGEEVVFGLELNPRYVFSLDPGQIKPIRFSLSRR